MTHQVHRSLMMHRRVFISSIDNMETGIKKTPHLGLVVTDDMPDILIDKIIEDIKDTGVDLQIQKRPSMQVMASIEFASPTVIIAFVATAYFTSLIGEAAKDHYPIVKGWLKKLANGSRNIKVTTITADMSSLKTRKDYSQSKAVSMAFQIKDGRTIKLLFDLQLNEKQWDNAIENLMDLVLDNYQRYPMDKLTQKLTGIREDSRFKVYAIINRETGELNFYDESKMSQLPL